MVPLAGEYQIETEGNYGDIAAEHTDGIDKAYFVFLDKNEL